MGAAGARECQTPCGNRGNRGFLGCHGGPEPLDRLGCEERDPRGAALELPDLGDPPLFAPVARAAVL